MNVLRFLLLSLAIYLASGVKAQFYDSADDIQFYVKYKYESNTSKIQGIGMNAKVVVIPFEKSYNINDNSTRVLVFNFDGEKAAILDGGDVAEIKSRLKSSSSYYEDKVESTEYVITFSPSSSTRTNYIHDEYTWSFTSDRDFMTETYGKEGTLHYGKSYYRRVDKSFFKVGRSRTPSGTMHE